MRVRIFLSVLLILSTFGCKSHKPATAERRFPIEGRVVAADPAAHTITLDHHEVVGYMKAMTMAFTVRDAWVFNVVHPGDTVQATLVVSDDAHLENISVTQARTTADLSTTSPMHLPQQGERFRTSISSTRRAARFTLRSSAESRCWSRLSIPAALFRTTASA